MSLSDLPREGLLFVPLGGAGEIGMNLNLYACDGQWLMVDLGMTFADPGLPGVDLVFPDPSFIEMMRDKLLGIVLTHGHEDHIGAVPYLWPELEVPIYATPFTASLVRLKLEDMGLHEEAPLIEVPLEGGLAIGPFHVRYLSLAHSIPEGNALLITTRHGRVFHTGDWKLDDEPIIGRPTPPEMLRAVGDEGVLALVGDSTNIFNAAPSGSEGKVGAALAKLVAGMKGRVVVTTFASNAARIESLGEVARASGRQLIVAGRSLERIIALAKRHGYLADLPPLVPEDAAGALPPDKQLIVCTGCQGEPRAALYRIAFGAHKHIAIGAGDTVIFSSKIIPGNERALAQVYNQLAARDIDVVTEKDAFVHVSGHPSQPELADMLRWIRPRLVVPVHGEMRHMKAHAAFAKKHGAPQTLVPRNGSVLRLAPEEPAILGEVATGRLALDGDDIVPEDSASIIERRRIAQHGYAFVGLTLNRAGRLAGPPMLAIKGVPGGEDAELREIIDEAIADALARAASQDDGKLGETIRISVRRSIRAYCGKNALTDVKIARI
ncbi:MAG: ribonuclease J [Pseudomonadota bacterium]